MTTDRITTSCTVNHVMRQYPATMPVLNALGVDTCCGGGETLGVAASGAGIAPAALIDALMLALPDATTVAEGGGAPSSPFARALECR